jgi:hypothetical protein
MHSQKPDELIVRGQFIDPARRHLSRRRYRNLDVERVRRSRGRRKIGNETKAEFVIEHDFHL